MYYTSGYHSPLGNITLACDNKGEKLVGLWLEGQKYYGGSIAGELHPQEDLPLFGLAKTWLGNYFAGKRPAIATLPLAPPGSAFRQKVWRLLCKIPYGEVTTYGAIAKQMAAEMGKKSMSGQAVGGAVGHNPISVIIPCHRVLGASGSLTGYAGGLEKKAWLLQLEGADLSHFRQQIE